MSVRMRRCRSCMRRSIDLVVGNFSDDVDAKSDEGDSEARSGVAELVSEHRMLPPCIPSPEEFPSWP